jgi:peptidoglycan/xylan/chitin deacetylase (PgdA/CDA1 family)
VRSAPVIRQRVRRCLVGAFAIFAFSTLAGTALAAPNTTVSFTFDDGRPSQMAAAQELAERGMTGSFYIVTSEIGAPGVMTLRDLNTLKAAGMEIGAHSVLHRDLPTLASDEVLRELCLSRNWLMERGFDVHGMAYPHDWTNAAVKQQVAACGYKSARTGGQLLCGPYHYCAETLPPLDPYALRTPPDFNMWTTLADMKAAVTNAQNNGGGWVPLELHDVCDGPADPFLPAGAPCTPPYVIPRAFYLEFLDWLKAEVDTGRVQVKTVREVVGGVLHPPVPVDPVPPRTGNLLVNHSFEQPGTGSVPSVCWDNVSNGPDTPPTITTTSDAHHGSKALVINVPAMYDSWAFNLIAPELDLAQCSPAAIAAHRYTFTGWYKGDGQIRVVAYWRDANYRWARLGWGSTGTATFPAAAAWAKATFTFQTPAGATGVSAGFYVDGTAVGFSGNNYTIDDTRLVDDGPATFALAANAVGTGTGTVTSNPVGIACGATCQAALANGASVTLTAVAAPGSSFTGWGGACAGTSPICTLAMTSDRIVTATFAANPADPPVPTPSTEVAAPAALPVTRPNHRARPQIGGRARVGRKLVCTRGRWLGSPTRYAFTWRRNGKLIVGRGASYRVRPADRGHAIRCSVTARNAKGASTVASGAVRVPY